MWRRFTAHRMILWGGTLLFRAQIYGNVLCFPAAGNAVKIKSSCILNSWRRTEKLYLRVSYCKILLTSKSQAFFLKTNQQKTRSKTRAVGFRPDVFDSMRNGTGGSSDWPSGNAICVFLEEGKETLTKYRFAHQKCEVYQLPQSSKMFPSSKWTLRILWQI